MTDLPTLPLDLDPIATFRAWLAEAELAEPADANAMTVATVDAGGRPSARILLLKGVDDRGFVFYTNSDSRKGLALAANPVAALLFYWKSLNRQVRVEGPVVPVADEEADAYFQSRGRDSRIGAWASQQSRPLPGGRAELMAAVEARSAEFGDGPVPRPPHWLGYRVVPETMELWIDRAHRLHDRAVFTKTASGGWTAEYRYP